MNTHIHMHLHICSRHLNITDRHCWYLSLFCLHVKLRQVKKSLGPGCEFSMLGNEMPIVVTRIMLTLVVVMLCFSLICCWLVFTYPSSIRYGVRPVVNSWSVLLKQYSSVMNSCLCIHLSSVRLFVGCASLALPTTWRHTVWVKFNWTLLSAATAEAEPTSQTKEESTERRRQSLHWLPNELVACAFNELPPPHQPLLTQSSFQFAAHYKQ